MNNVFLTGRLTADPNLYFTPGKGTAICRFRLAVQRPFKKDETDFINCIAFGKNAENIAHYLTKGRKIAINGYLQTGSYDAKDGSKRYTTDVIVSSFEFIDYANNKSNNNATTNNNSNINDNLDNFSHNHGEFSDSNFEQDMIPMDDSNMPFWF